MDDPRTVRVALMYRDTLTEGVGGWGGSLWMIQGLSVLL